MGGSKGWTKTDRLTGSLKEQRRSKSSQSKNRTSKMSAVEARRAVEDFILMKNYQDLLAEF